MDVSGTLLDLCTLLKLPYDSILGPRITPAAQVDRLRLQVAPL